MKTTIGGLILGIILKLFIIWLYSRNFIKTDRVNFNIVPPDSKVNIEKIAKRGTAPIFLKISYDIGGADFKFKAYQETPMNEVFSKAAKKLGVENNDDLMFIYDGSKLEPFQTVGMLQMKDGDKIYCMLMITLKMVFSKGSDREIKITVDTPMSEVFSAVAKNVGKAVHDLKFFFFGDALMSYQTPRMLEMLPGDEIRCLLKGGYDKMGQILLNIHLPLKTGFIVEMIVEHDTLMSEVMSEAITLGEMTDEIDSSDLELIFNGVKLYPHQMVSMLKMEDGDVIHCVLQNNAYINVVDKDRFKIYDTAP